MSEEKDSKDNKNTNQDKDQPKVKKTLSLGVGVNLSSLNTSSDNKKVRGRIVEVKVIGRKKPDVEKDSPSTKKTVDKTTSNNSSLTKEEVLMRQKILENAKSTKDDTSGDVPSTTFQVVGKEDKELVLPSEIDVPVDLEASNTRKNREKDKGKLEKSFDDTEETLEKVKPKKLSPEIESKKKLNKASLLKSILITEDDYEEDLEEGELEEAELEEKVVMETTQQPTYYQRVKRKSKYKQASNKRDKLVRTIKVIEPTSVQSIASRLAEKAFVLLKTLSKMGIEAKPQTILDIDTIELLVSELGHKFVKVDKISLEDEYLYFESKVENLKFKPPVVTVMGHVDHGKTTLLDTIRKSNVAAKESGGITQHIGAYQVKTPKGNLITFLDTPGHEAFSQIRARGSKITDIVVLVVASDDGIKPQTIEAINHAKFSEVPIIVAINKIDKPQSDPQKVKTALLQHNIVVEDMGGEIQSIEISAKANMGIDNLLEAISLQAEIMDLKADSTAPAKASVIEVKVEKGFGVLATVLVERGTLKLGDYFVCGLQAGKVKVMINDKGERVKQALPAAPVEISGFNDVVSSGDSFLVVSNEAVALDIIEERKLKIKEITEEAEAGNTAHLFVKNMSKVKTLSLIVKADAHGSLEAILGSLKGIEHDDVEVRIVHSGVGEITESDIMLSTAGSGIIIGFNVRANTKARDLALKEKVDIRYHSIIYNLIDDVKLMLTGLLDPDIVENIIGYAEIREVFTITGSGKIAGCYVKEGMLRRASYVRLLRNNVIIHSGVLSQLKRFKEDVKEVNHGYECGASFEGYADIQIGDMIECYEKLEVKGVVS